MDIKKTIAKVLIALTFFFPATEALTSCNFEPIGPGPGVTGKDDEREQFEEKKEMLNNFVSKIDKNFEVTVYNTNMEAIYKNFVNENFVKQIRPYPDGKIIYISKENNNDYVYNLDDDGNYHKSKLNKNKNYPLENYLKQVHDFVNSFSWNVYYDEKNNLLSGEAEYNMRIPITASITEEKMVINIMNEIVVFENLNKVNETLPKDWIDDTNKQEEIDKEAFDKQKAKFDSLFSRIHDCLNFRYRMYNDQNRNDLVGTAYFNKNFVKMTQNKPDVKYDDERWFSKENGENYTYYKDQNGKIHKRIAEESDMTFDDALSIVFKIENANFETYEDGRLKGYVELENGDKQELEVYVADDGIEVFINDQDCLIGGIGWVEEKLPEDYILDKVDDKSNLVYFEKDNGEREYNIPLLAKALEESLNDEIMTKLNSNLATTLNKVLYINSSENSLSFGSEFETPNSKYLGIFDFNLNKLNDSSMKYDDFCSLLKEDSSILTLNNKHYSYKDSTLENDHIRELAEHVIRKYAKSGIQDYYKPNLQDKPEPEYKNAKVLYVGKSKDKGPLSGNGLGNITCTTYIMVLDRNGILEQAIFDVTVRAYGKDYEYCLLQENQEFVLITSADITNLDYSNSQLYENEQKEKSNDVKQTSFIEEDKRILN